MLEFVTAGHEHVIDMAPRLRAADCAEIEALGCLSPAQMLELSVSVSDRPIAVLKNGRPIAMLGVTTGCIVTNTGCPWLLCTDEATVQPFVFLGECRWLLDGIKAGWSQLENVVDARNATAIRWLRWLGFTIHDAEPMGVHGLPFHRFTMDV